MELDEQQLEGSPPIFIDCDELHQPKTDINLISDLEDPLRKLFIELQVYRLRIGDNLRLEAEANKYREEAFKLQKILEYTRKEGERAAATAERMVKERNIAMKRLELLEPRVLTLEREQSILEESVKTLSSSLEESQYQELNARARLEAISAAKLEVENQMQRIHNTFESLQRNQTGYEDALRLMRGEIGASIYLHETMRAVEERQRKRIDDMASKLRDAIEQHAKLSEQLGEARAMSTNGREFSVNDPRAVERELMERVREERADAETLRESLEAAAAAQTRLLGLQALGTLDSPTKPH